MPPGLTPETVGPVDVAVFAFDGNRFHGEIAPALLDLQRSGTVRVLDATLVVKDAAGDVSVLEVTDSELASSFEQLTDLEFDLLSDEDLAMIADGLAPDSSALALVWENTWAARLATAIRSSGGVAILQERVPRDDVVRAIKALDQS